jgi:imidazolonepropionase-like amidohydrolase
MVRTAAVLALLATVAGAEDLWIANANLIDGSGGGPQAGVHVRVSGRRIAEIRTGGPAVNAANVKVLDLKGAFLLPGLVDAHAHIESPAAARRALFSGVTTARVLGDHHLTGLATRDLVKAGHVPGPEILASAGHVRPRLGESFILSFPQFGRYLDQPLTGAANVAEVVRAVLAKGADVVKVGASERAGLAATDPRRPELTQEEMAAAVAEATKAGRFVAAHAHARKGARDAVLAGVRSIEHGTYLDDETLRLMKERGTFLVPTLAVMSALGDPRGDGADAITLQLRTHQMERPIREVVKKAKALGIVIAASTDGTYGDGDDTARIRVAHDIEALIACGFSPLEAITAATAHGARMLGLQDRTGRVASGLEADLLVVDRNPLEDPTTLFEPMLVVSDGAIVLNRLDR